MYTVQATWIPVEGGVICAQKGINGAATYRQLLELPT